jgi:hypothetical protein
MIFSMRTINLDNLEKAFEQIILKLKREEIEEIQLTEDYYKFIPTDEWSNLEEDVILVGSLIDDIDSLYKVLNEPHQTFTYVDFDRIASILRAISETLNPVNG